MWTPDASLDDGSGTARNEFVHAALDCPTAMAAGAAWGYETVFVLGELASSIDGPVRIDEPHVAYAWPLTYEGRKRRSAMAIATADGEVVARSEATWIDLATKEGLTRV